MSGVPGHVGRRFAIDGVIYIPLPHPSGASRWLNVPAHRRLLGLALEEVRREWERIVRERGRVVAAQRNGDGDGVPELAEWAGAAHGYEPAGRGDD